MQIRKAKIVMIVIAIVFIFFFSSDFGLIDVEKTSIITAIAIDKADDNDYLLTAQIAVPEATDTNSENLKTQISGKGSTVGEALKDLGDLSGWFPKLSFCNLIIIGKELASDNVIKVLDYFAKTLRVQDSALVALSESTAKELLSLSTPLDNISAFALQKIMLKNTGFDRDVADTDVKTFCSSHYSFSSSAYMPIIKVIPAGDEASNGSGSSGSQNGSSSGNATNGGNSDKSKSDKLFDARSTALFKEGKKVGELDSDLTLAFNSVISTFKGTTIPVKVDGKGNYLLSVLKSSSNTSLTATDDNLTFNVTVKLYCKISDHSADGSDQALSQNKPLPTEVINEAKKYFYENLEKLVEVSKSTQCDFFHIKEKLYRFNNKQYSRYKDNYLSVLNANINVDISGQK